MAQIMFNQPIINTFQDGSVKEQYYLLQGNKNGEYIQYYKDGSIKMKCNYINGKLEGIYISYWPNRKIHTLREYSDGKLKERRFQMFNQDGKIIYDDNSCIIC